MLNGNPAARAVSVLVGPATGAPEYLTGDGWLPSDLDGGRRPPAGSPNYIVGTQDDEGPYGAPFDAINVFRFFVSFGPTPTASFTGPTVVPVAEFDSDYPCVPPGSRNCIPQPGTNRRIDILSYRQRPTWRLAYRNFGTYESLVTSQSVEASGASPACAGTSCAAPATSRSSGRRLRARRRRQPLDGQHRPGQEGQHGPRLQRVQRDQRLPGDSLHRPAQGRPRQHHAPGSRR